MIIRKTFFVFVLIFIAIIDIVTAEELRSKNQETAQNMYDNIMSPYCPGRTLSACPSDDARKLREQILHQINQGYSPSAIERQLQAMFGSEITGKPPQNKLGLLVWFLPFTIILICIYVVLIKIKCSTRDNREKELSDYDTAESKLMHAFDKEE